MALGAAVTERLRFMTGVTNPATRHPAALATAIATVHEVSKGRAVLGTGGGTLRSSISAARRCRRLVLARVDDLHCYCAAEPSTRPATQPVAVARSRPSGSGADRHRRVGAGAIAFAATHVERVASAVRADPSRMAWALRHSHAGEQWPRPGATPTKCHSARM